MRGEERRKVREKLLDPVSPSNASLTPWVFISQDYQVCVPELPSFAGYHCEPYNNPADFFLDVINGDSCAVVLNREDTDGEG